MGGYGKGGKYDVLATLPRNHARLSHYTSNKLVNSVTI